jgi:hypothetical protein
LGQAPRRAVRVLTQAQARVLTQARVRVLTQARVRVRSGWSPEQKPQESRWP